MPNRPAVRLYNPRNSVLHTQEKLLAAERELREVVEKAKKLRERVERLKNAHREQIARSLTSKDSEERQMALNVREWWQVPLPEATDTPSQHAK